MRYFRSFSFILISLFFVWVSHADDKTGVKDANLESKKQKYKASSDCAPTISLKGSTASIKSQRRPLSSKNQNLASPRIPNYEQLFWRNRVSSPYYYHGAAFNFHPMTINRAVPYWYHQHYPHYGANYHQQYYLWRNRPIYY